MARRDPLLEQALLETSLKLGPEANALRSLLTGLAGSYSRTRRVNASNAAGIREATRQATPEVGGAFAQALQSSQAQRAALGVSGSEPQAAAYERRIMEQRANALSDLSDRGARAEEGRVFANQTARDEYLGDKAKIVGQLQELAGREGAEVTARYGQLREAQRGRAVTTRGQTLSSRDRQAGQGETARHNREMEANARQSAATRARGKPATPEQHSAAKDGIDGALTWIRRLSQSKMTSPQIRDLLVGGGAIQVGGQEVKVPKFSKDFVNAAYDIQVHGGLSPANVKALHRRRLSVRQLGYPTARPKTRPKHGMVDALAGLVGSIPPVQGG